MRATNIWEDQVAIDEVRFRRLVRFRGDSRLHSLPRKSMSSRYSLLCLPVTFVRFKSGLPGSEIHNLRGNKIARCSSDAPEAEVSAKRGGEGERERDR